MKISGRELVKEIYEGIQKKLEVLRKNNSVPKLVIVKSCNSAAVNNYIGQKIKKGEKVGVRVEVIELSDNECNNKELLRKKIVEINKSSAHHGIIFQKPGNAFINDEIEDLIDGDKDVDGFLKKSSHKPPVYRGVIKVLEKVFGVTNGNLISLLKTKNIVLIGKGKTGGQTIISGLQKDGFDMEKLKIIDSKTSNENKTKSVMSADIVISAVGKQNPVDFHLFSKKITLIDIGIHFNGQNKIMGDFNEEDIKDRVSFYTTTPGGIGATTVAYLMDNVVNAAINIIKN